MSEYAGKGSNPSRFLASIFFLLLIPFLAAQASEERLALRNIDIEAYPLISARAAILMDAASGDILYEKNPDLPIPPASLTKLMTIHLAFREVEAGRLSLDDYIPILKEDCAPDLPYRSSLMFLEAGMRVRLRELLVGLAIPSGNDAALALARAISGSLEGFAMEMNAQAREMGLSSTVFVEPSGLSERNMTTARDFANFCRAYVREHPQALKELHSLSEIRFPLLEHMPPGYGGRERPIEQKNRNSLIFDYPGCDGLKTGYIDESGYNIALTAERGTTRFIAVLLGGPGSSTVSGSVIRAENGKKLLDYGFDNFQTLRPQIVSLRPVRVWKGKRKNLELRPESELVFTARRDEAGKIVCDVIRDKEALAPISKGQEMGELVFSAEGRIVKRIKLVAVEDIPAANPLARLWDGIILFFRGGLKRT